MSPDLRDTAYQYGNSVPQQRTKQFNTFKNRIQEAA